MTVKPTNRTTTAAQAARTPDAEHRTDLLSNSTTVRYLDKLQVLRMLSISATGLHDLMVKSGFPRPFVLSSDPQGISGKSYWLQSEVEQFMLSRPRRVLKCDGEQGVA